jgi:sortase (surface protein transpeptidase)
VVVGHVDSREGPAVFFRLRDLDRGDRIAVDRADGTTVEFTVGRTERYRKNSFPTAEVYGDTPNAQLRLITCGGAFDRRSGHYLDNVVVYADRLG